VLLDPADRNDYLASFGVTETQCGLKVRYIIRNMLAISFSPYESIIKYSFASGTREGCICLFGTSNLFHIWPDRN
jgi:hypothetical protein